MLYGNGLGRLRCSDCVFCFRKPALVLTWLRKLGFVTPLRTQRPKSDQFTVNRSSAGRLSPSRHRKPFLRLYRSMQSGDEAMTAAETKALEDWMDFRPSTSIDLGVLIIVEWCCNFSKSNAIVCKCDLDRFGINSESK